MKVGDLVQLSKDAIMCVSQDDVEGQGLIIAAGRIEPHGKPHVWAVLWDDGAIEPIHFADLVVINESR
jgi:hypothetical protein